MQRGLPLALALLLLAPALAALAPSAAAASVAADATKLPTPAVGIGAAYVDGKNYLFGGRDPTGAYLRDVQAADLPLKRVSTLDVFGSGESDGRYSGAAVALGGTVYYFGGAQLVQLDVTGDGQTESVPQASKDVFALDVATGEVTMLTEKLPYPVFGLTGVAAQGKAWLFGGFQFDLKDPSNIRRHDEILVFDPSKPAGSRVRTVADTLPYAVQDAAGAYVGSGSSARILLMGGLSDHDNDTNPCPARSDGSGEAYPSCITRRIVSFDPGSELVRGVAGELPYRVQFARAGVVDGKAYVLGGLLADGSPTASIVEVTLEGGSARNRTLIPTLPAAAYGQAVTSDGSKLYLFGGRTGAQDQLLSDVLVFDPRVTVPWAPRSATAVEVPGAVRLSWEAPAYNGDGAISAYRVYRTAAGETNETLIGQTPSLSYDDATVKPGVEYVWRVVAVNSAGESAQSARITRTASISVPSAPIAFQAFPSDNQAALRWHAPEESGGANVTGYRIVRDGALLATVGPDNTSFEDRTVKNGATYAYQVRAYNSKGDGALTEALRVMPAPVPPPPTGVVWDIVEQASGASVVELGWVAPLEPVQKYIVYRTTSAGKAPTAIGETAGTSFQDNLVERGRTYYYTIISSNEVGTSPPSPEVVVSLVSTPGAPTDVVALGLEGEIRVQWQAPADTGDAPASALRYYVSRSGGGSSREIIVKTDIVGTTFADRAVTPGQSYTYTVTTLNPKASAPSAPATATAKAVLNKAPVALLAILPSVTSAGAPVELDASQSTDADGAIRSYVFDFGDGTEPVRSLSPTVTHAYAANGTFTASVVVTDDRSVSSPAATARVVVGEPVSIEPEDGLPAANPGETPGAVAQPGAQTPKVPGPGLLLVAAALGAAALARRALHRPK